MRHHQEIIQREDGLFQIGLGDDAPGPFQSREFAYCIAWGNPPAAAPAPKFRRLIREVRDAS